jgi:hypothetical protein
MNWSIVVEVLKTKWFRISGVLIFSLFLFYCFFLNYNEPTDLGIVRNQISGAVWIQRGGFHLTVPWVRVAKMDLRPMRVEVNSAGRGFSAKLVQFDDKYWQEFVNTEGFYYYWWANRFSFNGGYKEEHRGVRDIVRGYAYSAKRYPFIKILNEYQESY